MHRDYEVPDGGYSTTVLVPAAKQSRYAQYSIQYTVYRSDIASKVQGNMSKGRLHHVKGNLCLEIRSVDPARAYELDDSICRARKTTVWEYKE
jgi:hypothetical protein